MRKRFSTVLVALGLISGVFAAAGFSAEPSEEAKKSYNTAVEAVKAGDTVSAVAGYEAAVKAYPDYLDAHINVAAIYNAQGKADLATNHMEEVARLDSSNTQNIKDLATLYTNAGRLEQATTSLTKLSPLDPKGAASGWSAVGTAKKKKGDTAGAKTAYEMAIKAAPTDSKWVFNLANLQMDSKQYEDAIESYKKAIALNPKYIDAYYNLAICSHQLDMDKCVPDYEAFLKVAQGSSRNKARIAEVQEIVKKIKDYLAAKGE